MSKTTNITLIIDRSGSMASIASEVIGGINAFIEEQKKLPDPATVTYTQFDNVYEVLYKDTPLQDVTPLTHDTFVPRGMTALYDAIGKTLVEMAPDPENAQIIVVMTDGMENSSKEFTHTSVKTVIEASQKKGWQIIFMGANIDAGAVGGAMGIKADNINTYVTASGGSSATLSAMSAKTSSMRSAYSSSNANDWADAGGSMTDLYNNALKNV